MNGEDSSDDVWHKNFRLSRNQFNCLVQDLRAWISPDPKTPNYRALSAEKKVAVTLYYLKDTGSLCMTANSFGLALPTTSSVISEVCTAICNVLGKRYIHLPRNPSEMRNKVAEFEAKFGMLQAFGCIDGTHVPIIRPSESSQDFYSYKGYFSLNVQAVCDYRGYFMDVDCRWPGSVHDAKVFSNSAVNKILRDEKNFLTYHSIVPGCEKVPNYLIGDPAYPLLPYCMKEFENCDSNEKVVFNNLLHGARNPIECAFGRLKARWGVLTKTIDLKLSSVPVLIYACFILHNICEENRSFVDEDLVKTQREIGNKREEDAKSLPDPVFSFDSSEGALVRDVLTKYVRLVLPDNIIS